MERGIAIELTRKYGEFADWFDEMTAITLKMGDQGKPVRKGLAEMLMLADDYLREPLKNEHPDVFAVREVYEKKASQG